MITGKIILLIHFLMVPTGAGDADGNVTMRPSIHAAQMPNKEQCIYTATQLIMDERASKAKEAELVEQGEILQPRKRTMMVICQALDIDLDNLQSARDLM